MSVAGRAAALGLSCLPSAPALTNCLRHNRSVLDTRRISSYLPRLCSVNADMQLSRTYAASTRNTTTEVSQQLNAVVLQKSAFVLDLEALFYEVKQMWMVFLIISQLQRKYETLFPNFCWTQSDEVAAGENVCAKPYVMKFNDKTGICWLLVSKGLEEENPWIQKRPANTFSARHAWHSVHDRFWFKVCKT